MSGSAEQNTAVEVADQSEQAGASNPNVDPSKAGVGPSSRSAEYADAERDRASLLGEAVRAPIDLSKKKELSLRSACTHARTRADDVRDALVAVEETFAPGDERDFLLELIETFDCVEVAA